MWQLGMRVVRAILSRQETGSGFLRAESGQSLVELAVSIPVLVFMMAYAVDYGYFFIAAASITSSARDAVEYSSAGYDAPGQDTLPSAGPITNVASVSGEAVAGLATFAISSTTTTVQVCSKTNGIANNLAKCTSFGPSGTAFTPAADPEAPHFVLQRVDVTYTVQPPIPMTFFNISLLPQMKFHRQVSMRALD
jgi:Flp pilus assembly protein TadG